MRRVSGLVHLNTLVPVHFHVDDDVGLRMPLSTKAVSTVSVDSSRLGKEVDLLGVRA